MSLHTARHRAEDVIPGYMLWAMLGLVTAVLVLVAMARISDRPLEAVPPPAPVTQSRTIYIAGDLAGRATVLDATGSLIAKLSPEQGGFVSGVWRVLQRERTKHGVSLHGPVVIARTRTGRLSITDPSTGWSADLMGFGADNARAFAGLLDQP